MQDHKVFAHHDKWGTFLIPKAFLNTNNNASAAVPPKAVRQARGTHACASSLAHGTRRAARTARLLHVCSDSYTYDSVHYASSCVHWQPLPLHLSRIIRPLVHVFRSATDTVGTVHERLNAPMSSRSSKRTRSSSSSSSSRSSSSSSMQHQYRRRNGSSSSSRSRSRSRTATARLAPFQSTVSRRVPPAICCLSLLPTARLLCL